MTEEEMFINENKVDLVGLVKHKLARRNLDELERFEIGEELEATLKVIAAEKQAKAKQSIAAAAFEKTRKIRRE